VVEMLARVVDDRIAVGGSSKSSAFQEPARCRPLRTRTATLLFLEARLRRVARMLATGLATRARPCHIPASTLQFHGGLYWYTMRLRPQPYRFQAPRVNQPEHLLSTDLPVVRELPNGNERARVGAEIEKRGLRLESHMGAIGRQGAAGIRAAIADSTPILAISRPLALPFASRGVGASSWRRSGAGAGLATRP
jgi:hypothetical protein